MSAGFALIGTAPNPSDAAGALAIITDAQGRLLMQLRDDRDGIVHPGLWGLFGGGVEPGETTETAILRELDEELGLTIPPGTPQPFAWIQSPTAARKRLYIFTLNLEITPADLRLHEGAGFAFFTPAQTGQIPLIPALKPVLAAYLEQQAKN